MLAITKYLTKASRFRSSLRVAVGLNSKTCKSLFGKTIKDRATKVTPFAPLFLERLRASQEKKPAILGPLPAYYRSYATAHGDQKYVTPSVSTRQGIDQASEWQASDVQVWIKEVRPTIEESDVNILGNFAQDFVRWITGADETWTNLETKLRDSGFKHLILLKNYGDALKQDYQFFVQTRKSLTERMNSTVPREGPQYKYLTNPTEMKIAVNTFKPLPTSFGRNTKGYSAVEQFFISKQRFQIWNKYYKATLDPKKHVYIVPSGPHGIGKTGIGLMLAATAYFLKKPLFYYPECRSLLNKERAINTFYLWNGDLMDSDTALQRVWDALLMDNSIDLATFWERFTALPGAVLILDEHNEFYKRSEYQVGYSIYTSFQHFERAQLVMFIGAAHSKFENSIPDGYKESLIYIQPLTEQETRKFVKLPNSPIASLQWKKIPGHNPTERFRTLFNTFGGVYQPIVTLHSQLEHGITFEHASGQLQLSYYTDLQKVMDELQGQKREKFVTLLKVLIQSGNSCPSEFTTILYDCGLLYWSANGTVPVNGTAMDAIKLVKF